MDKAEDQKAEDQPPSPRLTFLTIPLEIRFHIYSYLLTLPPFPSYADFRPDAKGLIDPTILRVSRQINEEATPYLYHYNTFQLSGETFEMHLRAQMKPLVHLVARSKVARFRILVRMDPWVLEWDSEGLAEILSGAREVTLQLALGTYLNRGHVNLCLFDKVRGVRQVNFRGATYGYEDYIEWLRKAMTSEPGTDVGEYVRDETKPIKLPIFTEPVPYRHRRPA